MRIIKEGKIPVQEKQLECDFCHTIFGYEPQDCKDIQVSDSWLRKYSAHVCCPLCYTLILVYVDETEIMRYKLGEKRFM